MFVASFFSFFLLFSVSEHHTPVFVVIFYVFYWYHDLLSEVWIHDQEPRRKDRIREIKHIITDCICTNWVVSVSYFFSCSYRRRVSCTFSCICSTCMYMKDMRKRLSVRHGFALKLYSSLPLLCYVATVHSGRDMDLNLCLFIYAFEIYLFKEMGW